MKKSIITYFCALTAIIASAIEPDTWQGSLQLQHGMSLKLVLHFSQSDTGRNLVTLDSPNQGAYGIKGKVAYLSSDSISLNSRTLGITYVGHCYADSICGTFKQNLISRSLTLTPGSDKPNRPQTPQPPYPYTEQEVEFTNSEANATFSGTLTIPNGADSSTPVALLITGSGLQNRDEEIFQHKPFAVIADYLARNGIATLRYDDRSMGKSTGNAKDATTADFAEDAYAGIEFLKQHGFDKVGAIGHSEGASAAFMIGAKGKADFIVGLGTPSLRGDSVLANQNALIMKQNGIAQDVIDDYQAALLKVLAAYIDRGKDAAKAVVDNDYADWAIDPQRANLRMNLYAVVNSINPWLDYFIRTSPSKTISSVKCPAMALYGQLDVQVGPELNLPEMQRLLPNAIVKQYDGLNHLFQHATTGNISEYSSIEETISPEVLADITKFISNIK